MKIKFLLAILTLSLATFSVSTVHAGDNATSAIDAAKTARKEAKALGFEWRDMGKLIKKAEAAAKDGKAKKAIKIAKVVSGQLAAIKAQAKVAKTAGPLF
ncbi:MAG: hypothetical protein V3U71_05445 [Cocleimonas sp.]